ncbi:MAG: SGNH/GDSL hydrolase family protein [Mucilaginibacter polytrichastri]|nr:SGNH/GDSL hydrolase family protein [Mucilaginibacter polytrichastri]
MIRILSIALFTVIIFVGPGTFAQKRPAKEASDSLRILFLGDSYTEGYAVSKTESYPYQLVQQLNKSRIQAAQPVVIARSGWNTRELLQGIDEARPHASFDGVFLLIGVNNQYRGYALPDYEADMNQLLKTSVKLAGKNPKHVYVISIPDWGATPFAADKNPQQMSLEVGDFNAINKKVALKYGASFIDIFSLSQSVKEDKTLAAEDGLHPSGKMYTKWVQVFSDKFIADKK